MKQKDIAMLILVAAIAGVISFLASRSLFASTGAGSQMAEVVDPITTDFLKPSEKYFNSKSINPTQLIQIGEDTNDNPFGSTE